ncbi:TonB-dependent receptor plug domain-containing protein [Sphingomonas sp. KRR8]|uniref:TonB-dependent receptor plug domain-containing protein n=1 Tax=Sphingomonas sp. KRR8 TaxID=2942996 RepID=UPI002021BB1B|nr:TonB-dependent receptor plug domain-containing protein [Sphingomonas sp. KRR8]URD61852.1 TonB-dependent receptor plug domain-containing protein [Sphingomonas sp. KRR8]
MPSITRLGLFCTAAFIPALASAQTAPNAPLVTSLAGKTTFVPADFARFAPRTALDMLVQVPGFTIHEASQERGLGQASENVLLNGQRVANKSGGAIAELGKINASDVERIEILDAAQLGIAGLTGQVANVAVKAVRKAHGQFEWKPDIRAHYAHPRWDSGSISYNDHAGPLDYTLAVNTESGRGAFGGPIEIIDPSGQVVERRHEVLWSDFTGPKFSLTTKLDGPGSSEGNLIVSYEPYWARSQFKDRRNRLDRDDRRRITRQRRNGYISEANGDYSFALGPGRLKLIGLTHFEHEPTITTQITSFDSGRPDEGLRFNRDVRIRETVGRAEYGWKLGKNTLQFSLERAYNSLAQDGRFFVLDDSGTFIEQPLADGSGTVRERRYEGLVTFGRALSPKLDVQLVGGAEVSRLELVGGQLPPRKFFRPKGSVTVGWRPTKSWDVSLKLNRKIGQISFYDFLDQPRLSDDRNNNGNALLVPPQSWQLELEAGRTLGAWGNTRLRLYAHRITDIVDIIPIGPDGQGVGNLPSAKRIGFESVSTINFDPIGWHGAKLDVTVGLERTRVRDPLTGALRPISGNRNRWADISFRHDIPHSDWAYGSEVSHSHYVPYYYLTEVSRTWEGPWFDETFIENKDVAGLTVRFAVANLLNARHRQERFVYDGRRNTSPLLFRQSHDQLIGPIFALSVKGSF